MVRVLSRILLKESFEAIVSHPQPLFLTCREKCFMWRLIPVPKKKRDWTRLLQSLIASPYGLLLPAFFFYD